MNSSNKTTDLNYQSNSATISTRLLVRTDEQIENLKKEIEILKGKLEDAKTVDQQSWESVKEYERKNRSLIKEREERKKANAVAHGKTSTRILEQKIKIKKLTDKLEESTTTNEALRDQLSRSTNINIELEESQQALQKTLKSKKIKIEELEKELNKIQNELKMSNIFNETNQHVKDDWQLMKNLTESQGMIIQGLRKENTMLREREESWQEMSSQHDLQQSMEEDLPVSNIADIEKQCEELESENKKLNRALENKDKTIEQLEFALKQAAKKIETHEFEKLKHDQAMLSSSQQNAFNKNRLRELNEEIGEYKKHNDVLARENKTLKSKLEDASEEIREIAEDNRKLSLQNDTLNTNIQIVSEKNLQLIDEKKEVVEMPEHQDPIEKNLAQDLQETKRLNEIKINALKMKIIKDTFNEFVAAYKKQNRDSGLFSKHGYAGRQAAGKYEEEFNRNKKYITSKQEVLDYLVDLKTENPALLTGNCSAGSFKTYLLAYYDYVEKLDMSKELTELDLDITKHVKEYVSRSSNIKQKFEDVFRKRNTGVAIQSEPVRVQFI